MAQTIKLKRTAVQGKIPNTSNLDLGELAINTYDGRIFFEKDVDGTLSIEEILTTNSTVSGSLNLDGAISASSFEGDGSLLTNISASSVSFGDITDKPTIVSGSEQINVTDTILYSSLANTGSNTYVGAQTIRNETPGQNNSLSVRANSTGDVFNVVTDNTANRGIVLNSKNATNTSDTKLSFSGSSFEFGGGDVNILGNLTLGGNITIGDNPADVITVTAGFSGSLIPDETTTYDLGSSSKKWNELYVETTYSNLLRLDESGTGLRMTNIGAFDKDTNNNFLIFSNKDLVFSTDGDSNTRLTINETSGDATFTNAVTASHFVGDGSGLTGVSTDVSQVATVTSSFDNESTISVIHSFDSKNVIVSVYDTEYSQLIPQSVTLTDNDTVDIVLSSTGSGHVVVAKGGHIIASSDLDSYREDVSGASFYTVTHSLDESYPFVQAWNTDNNTMEQPSDVESVNSNVITVSFSGTFAGKIIVKK